jgi:hypothetical protein
MFTRVDLDGRLLSFEPIVRPLMALASGQTRGAVLDRALVGPDDVRPAAAAMARLSAYDVEQLDAWILEQGLSSIDEAELRGAVLFAPATYSTLSSTRGRRAVLSLLGLAQRRLGARLVLEVTGLDHALPPSRLVEMLGAIAPVCRVVFARLRPERRAITALSACGLAGAAIDAARLPDPEDAEALTRLRLVLRAIGPRMLIHNLRTVKAIAAAREAGISYASLDIGGPAA